MNTSSIYVLAATVIIIVLVLIYQYYVLSLSAENIFRGSGTPISMAKIVLSAVQISVQLLFGMVVVALICVLILEDKLKSETGMPIISATIGFMLGKSFKDAYDSPKQNLPDINQKG
ncbi:MAG: hypothetical protein WCI31_06165 [Prolixibacteraceae bacterium]